MFKCVKMCKNILTNFYNFRSLIQISYQKKVEPIEPKYDFSLNDL